MLGDVGVANESLDEVLPGELFHVGLGLGDGVRMLRVVHVLLYCRVWLSLYVNEGFDLLRDVNNLVLSNVFLRNFKTSLRPSRPRILASTVSMTLLHRSPCFP